MATQTAKLNLVISANDKASKVIDQFVANLRKSTEQISKAMSQAINPKVLEKATEQAVNAVNTKLNEINPKAALHAFEELQAAAIKTRDEMKSSFGQIKTDFAKNMDEVKASEKKVEDSTQSLVKRFDYTAIQLFGQQVMTVGEQMGHFFLDAIKDAGEFDQGIANTRAALVALGETQQKNGQTWDLLKKKALDMGYAGYFSASQISEGMNTLARQGIHGTEILNGAIETVSKVAAANQTDLTETANVVSDVFHHFHDQLMKDYHGDVNKAFHEIGDSISGAMHHARMSMNDFINTLKYVGPQASNMGWSLKQTATAVALLGQAGIRGSQAGTSLRRMLTNLIPTTNSAKEAFHQLGLDTGKYGSALVDSYGKALPFTEIARKLHDALSKLTPVQQQAAVKAMFGQYALSGMSAAANEQHETLDKLFGTISKGNVTVDMLNEKNQGLGYHLQRLSNMFKSFKDEVGLALGPLAKLVVDGIAPLFRWFHALPEPVKQVIAGFGAAVAIFLTLGGAVVTAIGSFGLLSVGLAEFGLSIGAVMAGVGLFSGVLLGIVAVIVAVKAAWDNNLGGIKQKAKEAWDFITREFKFAMHTISVGLDPLVKDFKGVMKDISKAVGDGINEVYKWWKGIEPQVSKVIQSTAAFIRDKLLEIHKWWVDHKDKIGKTLNDIGKAVGDAIKTIEKWWNDIKPYVKQAVDIIWNGAKDLGKILGDIVKSIGDAVKEIQKWWKQISPDFNKAVDNIVAAINWLSPLWKTAWENIKIVLQTVWKIAVDVIRDAWNFIKRAMQDGWKVASGVVQFFVHLISGDWSKLWGDAKQIVSGMVDGVGNVLNTLWNVASDILGNLADAAIQWAQNMMDNFINGIINKIPGLRGAINSAANVINSLLGHHSPAKEGVLSDDDKWMPRMMNMFSDGIEANRPKLQSAVENVALDIHHKLNPSENKSVMPLIQKMIEHTRNISALLFPKQAQAIDPFLQAESNTAYDRIVGHTSHHPTVSDYIWQRGHTSHHPEIHIHINGGTIETNKQLANMIQDHIARNFRSQLSLQTH